MKTGPGWFDGLVIGWKTRGFMVLFGVMNSGNGIYPVFYAGRLGCITGLQGRSGPSWGFPGALAGLWEGADFAAWWGADNAAAGKTALRVNPEPIGFRTIKTGLERVKGGVLCRRLAYTCQVLA